MCPLQCEVRIVPHDLVAHCSTSRGEGTSDTVEAPESIGHWGPDRGVKWTKSRQRERCISIRGNCSQNSLACAPQVCDPTGPCESLQISHSCLDETTIHMLKSGAVEISPLHNPR